jgi:hypothetical protein
LTKPRTRLHFEELESRTLLSAASVTHPKPPPPPVGLSGTIGGTYLLGPTLRTTGATYELSGSGTVGPMGKVTAGAFLQAAQFISPGHAGGLVTLSNAKGTVVLQPSGTSQPGNVRLPAQFKFLVAWGTGAYDHLNRGGTVNLTLKPAPPSSHGAGRPVFNPPAGTFTLTFSP